MADMLDEDLMRQQRLTIASLTAQLDAVTSICDRCEGSGKHHDSDEAAMIGVSGVPCPQCEGAGRRLRCQGRLNMAEKLGGFADHLAGCRKLSGMSFDPDKEPCTCGYERALAAYDAAVEAEKCR